MILVEIAQTLSRQYPDIPLYFDLGEAGVRGLPLSYWRGVFLPI